MALLCLYLIYSIVLAPFGRIQSAPWLGPNLASSCIFAPPFCSHRKLLTPPSETVISHLCKLMLVNSPQDIISACMKGLCTTWTFVAIPFVYVQILCSFQDQSKVVSLPWTLPILPREVVLRGSELSAIFLVLELLVLFAKCCGYLFIYFTCHY